MNYAQDFDNVHDQWLICLPTTMIIDYKFFPYLHNSLIDGETNPFYRKNIWVIGSR